MHGRVAAPESANAVAEDAPVYHSEIFRGPRHRSHRMTRADVGLVLRGVYARNRNSLLLLVNVLLVALGTFSVTRLFDTSCIVDPDVVVGKAKVWCEPYRPLDKVVVDVDLNTSRHCYSSKSCVALGEALRSEQGKFRYNFIIGAYGFVYYVNGYRCQTEELEDALYIRMPVDSIYDGQDFMAVYKAVGKFHELLREGLECGRLLPNYTLTATGCGSFNSWCTQMLYQLMTERPGDRSRSGGAAAGGPRAPRYDQTTPGDFFNPLSLNRVYGYQYKLVVCTKTETGS